MIIKANLKKLQKLINPVEDPQLFNSNLKFQTNNKLPNDYTNWYDDYENKDYFYIKQLIPHSNNIIVKLNLNSSFQTDLLISDYRELCAAIISKNDFIYIELDDNTDLSSLNTLFGKFDILNQNEKNQIQSEYNKAIEFTRSQNSEIIWEINSDLLENSWGNKEFVFNQIQNLVKSEQYKPYHERENLEKIFNKISPEIFNEELIFEIIHNIPLARALIPNDFIFKENFIKQFSNEKNISLFPNFWTSNYSLFYDKDFSDSDCLQKYNKDNIIQFLQQNLFNNANFCLNLIKHHINHKKNEQDLSWMYYVDDEIKKTEQHQKDTLAIIKNRSFPLNNIFHESFFQNLTNLNTIISSSISAGNIKDIFDSIKKALYPLLKNEKDILSIVENNSIYRSKELSTFIFNNMDDKLQKSPDFINKISKHLLIPFEFLSDELKNNEDIILFYMKKYASTYDRPFYFSDPEQFKKMFISESNVDKIKTYLKNGAGCIFKEINNLKFLNQNPELLLLFSSEDLSYFEYSKTLINSILNDHDLTLKLIAHQPKFFKSLPLIYRLKPELANSFINATLSTRDLQLFCVDPTLFYHDDFCINTFLSVYKSNNTHEQKTTYIQKICEMIPLKFWNNEETLLKLAKHVDEGSISNNIFKNSPKNLQLFIETLNLTEGFAATFRNYFLNRKLKNESLNTQQDKRKNKI